MEYRQSLILCLVYAIFLVLGAVMFMFLEYEVIENREIKELREWTRLKELALQEDSPGDELLALAMWLPKNCTTVSQLIIDSLIGPGSQAEAVMEVESVCRHLHIEEVNITTIYPWTFIESLYFSMTVATTIGYGHVAPSLAAGRVMCMIYALLGIPQTGILLAWTSEFFGEQLFKLFKSKLDKEKQQSKKVIAAATFIYIAIGFVVFIFLPAVIFMAIEKWTYLEGVYYAFITLTTIGFGDFVSGGNTTGAYLYVYQVMVILWIMVGLGYWVMVANFITKALKSKRLQSSVLRSAEEMKKLMQQMGIKNHDPRFLRQHSKATVNFMLQLSNIIAVQGGMDNGSVSVGLDGESGTSPSSPGASTTTSSAPYSPVSSPMGIPGISALFGPSMNRTHPLGQLIGPLGLAKYLRPTPKQIPEEKDSVNDCDGVKKENADSLSLPDLQRNEEEDEEKDEAYLQKDPQWTSSGNVSEPTSYVNGGPSYSHAVSTETQIAINLEEEKDQE